MGRAEISSQFVGLSNVFVAGGARYVVGALWRVSQLATAFMLDRYSDATAHGMAVPGALNQAQRELASASRSTIKDWLTAALPSAAAGLHPVVDGMPPLPFHTLDRGPGSSSRATSSVSNGSPRCRLDGRLANRCILELRPR